MIILYKNIMVNKIICNQSVMGQINQSHTLIMDCWLKIKLLDGKLWP